MKNRFEYLLFFGLSKFFCSLGFKTAKKFSSVIAFFFFYIIPVRKKVVVQNLQLAFPDLTKSEILSLAYRSYLSVAVSLVEILLFPKFSKSDFLDSTKIINADLITQKFNEGKGLVLLSAHFGNWELGAITLSIAVNLPFAVVAKAQRNPFVDAWMNHQRTRFLLKLVPLGISIRQVYKELKDKNIVAIVGDQRGPSDGVRVNMFGISSATYPGPAALVVKSGAPLLMILSARQPDGRYLMEVVEIDTNNLPESEQEQIVEITQRHTSYLEKMIRQYPEQWLWMHKRWKY